MSITRRDLLARVSGVVAASLIETFPSESTLAATTQPTHNAAAVAEDERKTSARSCAATREFNGPYQGDFLNQIAFPMGGIGAGMICLEGTGALSKFSLRNHPELGTEPKAFAAVSIKTAGSTRIARVL